MANLRANNLSGEGGRNAYSGSVFFDGEEGNYLTLASGALISGTGFGTGDFTVEFWINQGVNAADYTNIISLYASTTTDRFQIAFVSSTIQVYTDTGAWRDTGYAPEAGVYEHIVFQRDYSGNTLKMYANGEEKWSVSNNRDYDEVFETSIGDGPSDAYSAFQGYLSNIRICIGHLVYSSNYFTPPTSPLTVHYTADDDKTVLLCCQDSNDPTQEATGKTITANGKLATAGYLETQPKVIPPVGVDAGNTFGGAISMNSLSWMYFPTGRTEERGRGRGVIFGGYSSPTGYTKDIYYIDIQSMGKAVHFGDITATRYSGGGCGSSTRGIIGGGRAGSDSNRVNIIEFVEIAITSNSLDFGDLTGVNAFNAGGGNQTRGIWMGGSTPTTVDTIEFVTIATKGDALDFGNLTVAKNAIATGASSTRMLGMGGGNPSQSFATIDLITIATTGNASDFGDLTAAKSSGTGVSSNTRAVAIGGVGSPAILNTMDFVTIATTGNATDFGDTLATYEHTGSVNNSIRGVITGARTPSYLNILEFITIATTGNSKDFGDIPRDNLAYVVGASDSHGGLS